MSQVLIRNVPPATLSKLKERARRRGRSLQAELKTLLEASAGVDAGRTRELAASLRRRLSGRAHSDSAALLAEDRRR